jgi:hypothetical protein
MPRDRIVWLKPAVARSRPGFSLLSAAAEARAFGAGGEDPHAEMFRQGVPAHDPPLNPRDEAIFLLRTAAEVEHALLVQYLYAAFSLKHRRDGGLTDQQLALIIDSHPPDTFGWRETLLNIAKEEMGHLMTVQNLLLLLGGPLNFEREHFPFLSEFYPFHFRLEPLTKESLAKYVLAEKPEGELPEPGLQEELMRRAGIDNQARAPRRRSSCPTRSICRRGSSTAGTGMRILSSCRWTRRSPCCRASRRCRRTSQPCSQTW